MGEYRVIAMEPKKSFDGFDSQSEDGLPLMSPEQDGQGDRDCSRRRKSSCLLLSWLGQSLLLATSLAFFWLGTGRRAMTDKECAMQLGSYSTAYDAVEYTDIRFQGAILDENPWKGHPNTQTEKAWDVITNQDKFSISEEDMRQLKKPLTQIKWPESAGGGYMASLEVFHQLHCLNALRQYTYKDYYAELDEKPFWFRYDNQTMRDHLDHCIDVLRASLMCNADVGIVTYSWVHGHSIPYPDFSTWHRCRDNVPLVQYHRQHRVNVPDSELAPGPDDKVLDRPPCERAYNDGVDPESVPEVCP